MNKAVEGITAYLAGIVTRLFFEAVSLVLLIACAAHLVYMFAPPAYYVAMHGGEAAARWVSVFAAPLFALALPLYHNGLRKFSVWLNGS